MIKIQRRGDLHIIKAGSEVSGRVIMWTNLYYYRGIVIDCGCINVADEIFKAIESIGKAKAVFITHHHEDHVGTAHLFNRKQVKIYASKETTEFLKDPPAIPEYRRIVWGQPKPIEAEPVSNSITINDVDINVFKTPGHSPDHVIYKIGDMLFTGDLIGSLKPRIAYYDEDYLKILNSVENIVMKLNFTAVLGGHLIAAKEDIINFIRYLKTLKDRITELYNQGYTIDDITNALLSNVPKKVLMMEAVSRGEWKRRYLVKSLLGLKSDTKESGNRGTQ